MPNEDINTTLRFEADITDFKGAMSEANRLVKLANSEFKATSSGMDDWANSTDGLSAKLRQLEQVQAAEQRKLAVLKKAYADVVEEQGENSKAAQDLQIKINNQQAAVNKAAQEHKKFTAELEKVERGADDAADALEAAGDAAEQAGKDAEKSGDGWTMAKDIIADLVSNAITGFIDSVKEAAEATREYRRDMAQMAQNASDAGQDMEEMKDILSDVSAVTGETDAAMEGLNMLMASGLDTKGIELAADALSGAATKFDGLKFEGIAEGLQETLATGTAVGPFAEMIERTGGNLEAFNEGLAACTTEAEQQQYILKWLADSGLKDVHDAYVQNNADLVAAEQAQFRQNEAMAAMGAAIEPVDTALKNMGAMLLEKLTPVIQNIVQWVMDNLPTIAPIITGIAVALGVLAAALAIQSLISGVQKGFALLNATMLANPIVLIVAAIAGLVAAFVALWNKSEAFRNFWINLWEGIKTAFSAVVEWFKNAAQSIANFFTNAWGGIKNTWAAAGNFFRNIWKSITGAFQNADSWLTQKFGGAWTGIKNAFSPFVDYFRQIWASVKGIFSAVKSVLSGNFSEAWAAIKGVFAGWGSFFSGLWDTVKNAFSNAWQTMKNVGKNIVEGIWNGISGAASWLWDKITGFGNDILGWFKGIFGIHSPSRVMRDEIGKFLGLGIAEGIEDSKNAVHGASKALSRKAVEGVPDGAGGPGNGPGIGGKHITINQYNTSPKALSRREIYRQTHNALALAGGA